ncbi:unnamed protein product, partial [marine sediment metagenome]
PEEMIEKVKSLRENLIETIVETNDEMLIYSFVAWFRRHFSQETMPKAFKDYLIYSFSFFDSSIIFS